MAPRRRVESFSPKNAQSLQAKNLGFLRLFPTQTLSWQAHLALSRHKFLKDYRATSPSPPGKSTYEYGLYSTRTGSLVLVLVRRCIRGAYSTRIVSVPFISQHGLQ